MREDIPIIVEINTKKFFTTNFVGFAPLSADDCPVPSKKLVEFYPESRREARGRREGKAS
jgi:hypothetical protein